jgi:Tfp pilus assembly protein PilF
VANTDNLERLLASGQDNAMLRFGLGKAYLDEGEPAKAAEHLRRAVEQDTNYSAAWKLLGRALVQAEREDEAKTAYEEGIRVAEARGDIQAAKEMRVFLKRLR